MEVVGYVNNVVSGGEEGKSICKQPREHSPLCVSEVYGTRGAIVGSIVLILEEGVHARR